MASPTQELQSFQGPDPPINELVLAQGPWGSALSCLVTRTQESVARSLHTRQDLATNQPRHAYQTAHSSQSTKTEGPTEPTYWAHVENTALVTRGESTATVIG